MAAVEAENCGKLGPAAALLFVGKVDICDDHAGGSVEVVVVVVVVVVGVAVDCGVDAGVLGAPPTALGGPLPALCCSSAGYDGSILRGNVARPATPTLGE